MNTVLASFGGGSSTATPPSLLPDDAARSMRGPLDAAALARPATVVRHRRHVLDPGDLEAGGGQRPDRGLATGARPLHEDVDLLQAVFLRCARRLLGSELRGERRRLSRTLETHVPGTCPAEGVALQVGDGDDGVVERGLDVGLAVHDVLLLAPLRLLHFG